jgi:hypothetical protein
MRYRDRDIGVTTLPILVDAVPYEKRDGRVIDLGRNDIAVRILPLDAVAGLFDPKRKEEINREFNQAFKAVSKDVLDDLKALVFLIQAIQGRSREMLMNYVKRKAPVEAARAEQHVANVLAELGERKPRPANGSESGRYLRDAVDSLLKRRRYPLSELSRQLNTQARRARFVLWWNESKRKFAPGLYCDNMATALATALFSRVVSPMSLAICQRCGNPFIRSKRVQRFCSLRCGNADRKARQRERATHRKSKQKAR